MSIAEAQGKGGGSCQWASRSCCINIAYRCMGTSGITFLAFFSYQQRTSSHILQADIVVPESERQSLLYMLLHSILHHECKLRAEQHYQGYASELVYMASSRIGIGQCQQQAR